MATYNHNKSSLDNNFFSTRFGGYFDSSRLIPKNTPGLRVKSFDDNKIEIEYNFKNMKSVDKRDIIELVSDWDLSKDDLVKLIAYTMTSEDLEKQKDRVAAERVELSSTRDRLMRRKEFLPPVNHFRRQKIIFAIIVTPPALLALAAFIISLV